MKKVVLWIIRIYQKTFSLDHGFLGKLLPNYRGCKFTPTCSEYTYEAIEKYGVVKGAKMGSNRLKRCNPWTQAGQYDPVK